LSAWKANVKSLYYLFSSSLLTKRDVIPALIVTKDDCPYCTKLKETLTEQGIQYEEISKDDAVAKGYWNNDWKTVPQLWLYKKHIGGYNDYLHYLEHPSDNGGLVDNHSTIKECAACEA
jgi:glutaredoxin